MPVGLVAFEVGALSLKSVRKVRTRTSTELNALGKSLEKQLQIFLTRTRPNHVTALLVLVALYLILSRCGPVLTRVGESAYESLDLNKKLVLDLGLDPVDLQSLKGVYQAFRGLTRVPGPFAKRSYTVVYLIMGNTKSKPSSGSKPEVVTEQKADDTTAKQVEQEQSEPPKKGASESGSPNNASPERLYKFHKLEEEIATGDLAILKRPDENVYHFAVFVQHDKCDPAFPLLLVKGKTKPLHQFDRKVKRFAHAVSAVTRIFYGDYEAVSVRHLVPKSTLSCHDIVKLVEEIPNIPFSDAEVAAVEAAKTSEERSAILCTFMVAHFYQKMGVLKIEPEQITPQNLQANLTLEEPKFIKLPPVKEGPIAHGDPPFLAKLVDGIMPPPDVETVPLGSLTPNLQTGDLVLFSGATSSGAIIKFFDHSLFSHIGIVVRTKYSSQVLVWEASTNKAGLVDIESGKVRKGVELLPLKSKVFSGWYDRVAIRRLTDISEDKRQEMYSELLKFMKEVQGRPYEKSKSELILSALDFQEEYLSFLRNTKEDLSSLFCSELVAEAYMRMGLWDRSKLSNEYTPDDFASKSDKQNPLQFGKLEKEVYIELKFDLD